MNAPIVLDGKSLAHRIKSRIAKEAQGRPVLATILVGDNPASATYVNMKTKACEEVGLGSKRIELPKETTTEELLETIYRLNEDSSVRGILLQHPVPHQIDERLAFDSILPEKDVDGVSSYSFGKLAMNSSAFFPCTPYGIILLLNEYNIDISGKQVAVVGRSPILGKPMAIMMTNLDATVTLCHSKTNDLPLVLKSADIVVGAVGKPNFVKADWLKEKVVLLDAGYNLGGVGDIDLINSIPKSSYYTPVPGGVGPMTIAVLLLQTLFSSQGRFSPPLK